MLAESLIVSEEERLVLADRAGQRRAEFVSLKLRDIAEVEKISRIQGAVPQKFVNCAVKRVGAGCGHDADLRARPLAEFRAVSIGNDVELAHGLDAQKLSARAARRDVDLGRAGVLHSVQQKKVFLRTAPRNGDN